MPYLGKITLHNILSYYTIFLIKCFGLTWHNYSAQSGNVSRRVQGLHTHLREYISLCYIMVLILLIHGNPKDTKFRRWSLVSNGHKLPYVLKCQREFRTNFWILLKMQRLRFVSETQTELPLWKSLHLSHLWHRRLAGPRVALASAKFWIWPEVCREYLGRR